MQGRHSAFYIALSFRLPGTSETSGTAQDALNRFSR